MSDDGSTSLRTDTLSFVIRVVQNEFHRKLIGGWDWVQSCGGFTGGCWYPDSANTIRIVFTNEMKYYRYINRNLDRNEVYSFVDTISDSGGFIYQIGFSGNYDALLWLTGDTLSSRSGDFVETFVRYVGE